MQTYYLAGNDASDAIRIAKRRYGNTLDGRPIVEWSAEPAYDCVFKVTARTGPPCTDAQVRIELDRRETEAEYRRQHPEPSPTFEAVLTTIDDHEKEPGILSDLAAIAYVMWLLFLGVAVPIKFATWIFS